MDYKIHCLSELNEALKYEAISVFLEGFYPIFSKMVSKDRDVLHTLFGDSFQENMAYACLFDNKVVGFLAYSNSKQRSVALKKEVCQRLLGRISGFLVYQQMGAMLCKVNVSSEKECYLDFLATSEAARGKGVGAALMNYALALPEYDVYTLDVLEKNNVAVTLYEKLGFCRVKTVANPIKMLSGYGKSIFMRTAK